MISLGEGAAIPLTVTVLVNCITSSQAILEEIFRFNY